MRGCLTVGVRGAGGGGVIPTCGSQPELFYYSSPTTVQRSSTDVVALDGSDHGAERLGARVTYPPG